MTSVARDHAPEVVEALARGGQATAGAVGEGRHAVHVRKRGQRLLVEGVGDAVRDGGRAVDARDHRDEVAGADAAVRSPVAVEAGGRQRFEGTHVAAGRVRGVAVAKREVVNVHVSPGGNRLAGAADRLRVLEHALALGDVDQRDLVSARHAIERHHRGFREGVAGRGRERLARRDGAQRDAHAVERVEPQQRRPRASAARPRHRHDRLAGPLEHDRADQIDMPPSTFIWLPLVNTDSSLAR